MFMIRIGHCKISGAAAIDEVKDPRYKTINLAQKALAEEEENITAVASFYTDEYAALMRDRYHYHQEAYNSVGTIAGNNTAYTLYNTGKWTAYPEPDEVQPTPMPEKVSVSYGNNTLTVKTNDETIKSAVVIKAEYDNGIMSGVEIYPISFTAKQAIIQDIEITANEKVYVWSSMDGESGMKPLSDVFVR